MLATFVALAAIFFLFELSSIDIMVQDIFYEDLIHTWQFSWIKETWIGIVFYSGVKISIIIFGLIILMLYFLSFRYTGAFKGYRKRLMIVWLSLIMVPTIIGGLKTATNIPCPCQITHFGGQYPYIKVLEQTPVDIVEKFRCFPAGHASGGFALMSLVFLFKTKKNKRRAFSLALGLGWSMGVYKMCIGDHFLSHTIISMLLAWLIILIIYFTVSNRAFRNIQTQTSKAVN